MNIKWHEIHSVNVKEMDEQHQRMIAIINRFFAVGPTNKEGLVEIAKEMRDYANYHLAAEETYFIKFQYPKTMEHKEQHDAYRAKVMEFTTRLQTEETAKVFAAMSEFLGNWWIYHINNSDQQYSECFNQHGLY